MRTYKCIRTYEWDGPDGMGPQTGAPEKMEADSEKMQKFKPKSPPMLYSAMFNKKQDLIFAGGAGRNEVRVFDYETGNIVCIISDMERSVLCMDVASS